MENKFKIGDKVIFGNSPIMLVNEIHDANIYHCVWFLDNEKHGELFNEHVLELFIDEISAGSKPKKKNSLR